jgi:hypothetical protein
MLHHIPGGGGGGGGGVFVLLDGSDGFVPFFYYFLCMERLEVISGRLIVSPPWIKAVITSVFL